MRQVENCCSWPVLGNNMCRTEVSSTTMKLQGTSASSGEAKMSTSRQIEKQRSRPLVVRFESIRKRYGRQGGKKRRKGSWASSFLEACQSSRLSLHLIRHLLPATTFSLLPEVSTKRNYTPIEKVRSRRIGRIVRITSRWEDCCRLHVTIL
jgi:hypothetical protein